MLPAVKKAFVVQEVLDRIEPAIAGWPKAALFELYDRGYSSVFEQMVACIISIRTMDEATVPVAECLFGAARTPGAMVTLGRDGIATLLNGSSFPGQKAATIIDVAQLANNYPSGMLPADFTLLTGIKGVGPKCANLALGIAGAVPAIGVDIHVHRITNRWGYVATRTPDQTLAMLEQQLPQSQWVRINRLLVPFGKHICTGTAPRCSTCPVQAFCQQVGVTRHR